MYLPNTSALAVQRIGEGNIGTNITFSVQRNCCFSIMNPSQVHSCPGKELAVAARNYTKTWVRYLKKGQGEGGTMPAVLWFKLMSWSRTRYLYPVFQIRILGSIHLITNPDPALFVSGFQETKKIRFFSEFFCLLPILHAGTFTSVFKDSKDCMFVEGSGSGSAQKITDQDPGGPKKTFYSVSGTLPVPGTCTYLAADSSSMDPDPAGPKTFGSGSGPLPVPGTKI